MRKSLYPVIHVTSEDQALRNVAVARDTGGDGCFLISHGSMEWRALRDLASMVAATNEGWQVGVNFLGLDAAAAATAMPKECRFLWVDSIGPHEPLSFGMNLWHDDQLLFGSVAFKYQPQPADLERAVREASDVAHVIVTSGPGTGSAPGVEKTRRMRAALGPDGALAIASGMTPDNVSPFLDHVDCFLVATGISKSFDELDARKCAEMARIVHGGSR